MSSPLIVHCIPPFTPVDENTGKMDFILANYAEDDDDVDYDSSTIVSYCQVCSAAPRIYKCPKCSLFSCSLVGTVQFNHDIPQKITSNYAIGMLQAAQGHYWLQWEERSHCFRCSRRIRREEAHRRLSLPRGCLANEGQIFAHLLKR